MDTILQGGVAPQGIPRQQWAHIPADLRELRQWALAAPGPNKRPLTVHGGDASSTDPRTWSDFETACAAADARGWQVGFMLHRDDPLCCIDLDVKDGTPAEQLARHKSIIAAMDSYTERSRSGRGWHVWVKGKIGTGRRRDGVEVYSQERFIICTGDVVNERPVALRQAMLDNMVSRMGPPAAELQVWGEPYPDYALAARASLASGELGQLFRGDWQGRYGSQSDADLALVKLLAPEADSPRECWETFLLSGLGAREKAKRPDYARSTLGVAARHLAADTATVQHGRDVASSLSWADAAPMPVTVTRHLRLLLDGDLDALPPLRWLVKGIIPDAGIGAIFGASGTFKSFLTLDLLAHVSNGREWFGHRVKAAPSVYVPFEGQGGISKRIKAWRLTQTAARYPDSLATFEPDANVASNIAVIMEPLNLREQRDRDKLVDTLIESGWAGGVLCIDTLAHASAGIEENSSAMGEMIGIFRDLQQRLGGVILLVHHSGKDESRGMRGWSGLHAAMDFVVECQKKGEPSAREAAFSLAKVKDGATGTAFGFRMHLVPLGFDEDGDAVTSLTVSPAEANEASDHPFVVDGLKEAAEDDTFVDIWVRRLISEGKQPTGRSLDGQLPLMKAQRPLTQKRLRDAIARLKGDGRLEDTPGGPSGAKWLRAVDVPEVTA